MADWTDENRAELIKKYEAANPTPENSMEIVKELAEEFDSTPNGARAILSRAKVYIKKTPATSSASSSSKSSGEKKESKADSLTRLTSVIESQGIEADEEIIGKLTGKAAAYFADTISKILTDEDESSED